jgi:hypothetical protein
MYGINRNTDSNIILSKIYNLDNKKLYILKDKEAIRLHMMIKLLKKNNIDTKKENLILLCNEINTYKTYKTILSPSIYEEFDKSISIIRNKNIINKLSTIVIICLSIYFDIINQFDIFRKNKKIWILIMLSIISFVLLYYYSYNYMLDEFKYNDNIKNHILKINSINDIYLYISNIYQMENDAILFKNLLERVNVDNIKDKDCCNIPKGILDLTPSIEPNINIIHDNLVDVSDNLVDTSNNLVDISDNLVDTSNNIVDTSNNIVDTSNNLVDTSNNIVDISDNLVDISDNLVDTSNNIININKKKRGRPANKYTKPKITKTKLTKIKTTKNY